MACVRGLRIRRRNALLSCLLVDPKWRRDIGVPRVCCYNGIGPSLGIDAGTGLILECTALFCAVGTVNYYFLIVGD